MAVNYGVLTEQGDLGLGFDVLTKKDNKVVNEALRTSDIKKDTQVVTENKKDKK